MLSIYRNKTLLKMLIALYNSNMPQDAVTLKALTQELNSILKGGRIEKITQPENDELMFTVRTDISRSLVLSANSVNPRVHLTTLKKDNPYSAPSFLMLMRKYLSSSRISGISLANFDRIIRIDFAAHSELQDDLHLSLFVELIGRYSNIILVGADGAVIDAVKHVADAKRCVLPKLLYEIPAQSKIPISDRLRVGEALSAFNGGTLYDYLFKNLCGFSAPTLLEILFSAGISPDTLTLSEEEKQSLYAAFHRFDNAFGSAYYQPCLSLSDQNKYDDFYIFPYKNTGKNFHNVSSLNEAVDVFVSEKDRAARLKASGEKINSAIKSALEKARRHIKSAREKLEECKSCNKYKLYGELLTANIYSIKKGAEKAAVSNYYDNGGEIIIQLDPMLNAQQNAQRYYKKYAKLKRAEAVSESMLKSNLETEDYLLSVRQNFLMAESVAELKDIEKELIDAKILRNVLKSLKNNVKPREAAPAKYNICGFNVLRGKNNLQNEKITFKTAVESDIWLHSKAYHGSHVVILTEGKTVPDTVLLAAAEIAAYYSEQRSSGKAEVDYCTRKNVKRSPSGNCGMVNYTNYNTLLVTPDSHEKSMEK